MCWTGAQFSGLLFLPPLCSIIGAWAAAVISDEVFKKILVGLMGGVTLWTLWNPLESKIRAPSNRVSQPSRADKEIFTLALGFFGVGLYGGFVQAGVGFLILAVTTTAGLDLVRGNAVKVLRVLVFTTVVLSIFASQGKVHWPMGLALAGR